MVVMAGTALAWLIAFPIIAICAFFTLGPIVMVIVEAVTNGKAKRDRPDLFPPGT